MGSVDGYGRNLNGASSQQPLSSSPRRGSTTSKIILTSYPGQAGVDPLPMEWGAQDAQKRGRESTFSPVSGCVAIGKLTMAIRLH